MKYLKLFEDFDLDKFMENPDAEFDKNADSPEIEEGDWVSSYRGTGQLLRIDGEMAKVKLTGSKEMVVNVPVFALKKIARPEGKEYNTAEEIDRINNELGDYIDAILPADEENATLNNPEAAVDYIEAELLLDVISLMRQDPDAGSYQEYDNIVTKVALLMDLAMEADPELTERCEAVLDKFYELSK
jgi:hypothetical protein